MKEHQFKQFNYQDISAVIKYAQFSILSPEQIIRQSPVEITETTTYNGNEPVRNGLFDPRMGVLERNKLCETCGNEYYKCQGHFGHIKLADAVFHYQFFDYVKKVLSCICIKCSKLYYHPSKSPQLQQIIDQKLDNEQHLDKVLTLCNKQSKLKRCGEFNNSVDCDQEKPEKINKFQVYQLIAQFKDKSTKIYFNPREVLTILQKMTDEDINNLGFNHLTNRPEWMICTVLPVGPPHIRPSVRGDSGQRSEDDLTHKFFEILKANKACRAKMIRDAQSQSRGVDSSTAEGGNYDVEHQALQYQVAVLVDNNLGNGIATAVLRSGRQFKSIIDRLKSKNGRLRDNMLAKRVDFSARSVITPGPHLNIDEIGVPAQIAINLFIPETINQWNIDKYNVLIKENKYPGVVQYMSCSNGQIFSLKNQTTRDKAVLELGDVVYRHLVDGDWIVFNRQPSLHRLSMMAHKVVIVDSLSFQLPLFTTTGYNGDFDGDEIKIVCLRFISYIKFYDQDTDQLTRRLKNYFVESRRSRQFPAQNKYLFEVVKDEKIENFKIETLKIAKMDEIHELTKQYILKFQTEYPNGYNNTDADNRFEVDRPEHKNHEPFIDENGNLRVKGLIYKVNCLKTLKSYIGQTHTYIKQRERYAPNGVRDRFGIHCFKARSSKNISKCSLLDQAIREYGEDQFVYELLEICDLEQIDKKEIYYIALYDTQQPNGYNIQKGGNTDYSKITNSMKQLKIK